MIYGRQFMVGLFLFIIGCVCSDANGNATAQELVIATKGNSQSAILVNAKSGWERRAADDLAKYIGLMTGAKLPVLDEDAAIAGALKSKRPLMLVGEIALQTKPDLKKKLNQTLKRKPILQADGIVLHRDGNRVYLAGNNDSSHYYAVAELLRRWGCRWYIPTEFGECIPVRDKLSVGKLDYAYSPPFELRTYWISWIGDNAGRGEFQKRNMMTGRGIMPTTGHALGKYVKGLGKNVFNIPLTDPKTAQHIAKQVEKIYAKGGSFSLGMEDGSYDSSYPKDQKLMKLQWDKYFLRWSVTDPMLELYNNVARILQKKYPKSNGKIGFLAYANMTIPPVRKMVAERSLFCELAPIDIDPIHGMDDPQSPPRQEYKKMLYKWAKVMQGRLAIYDYDQGMLVWRDIPNPSHQAFRQDVQHYRKAGVLGVNTESRNAIATTFLNLYMRARLLWNPDEDVDALLAEFYPAFYGPAAEPMSVYWNAIFDAWEKTIVTEHEYFVAPAIYTRELVALLAKQLAKAEKLVDRLKRKANPTRNESLYLKRMQFTRISFNILDAYLDMVKAAATDVDYAAAVKAGERGLKARKAMTDLGGIFTTTKLERGYAWWPGEVKQYRELLPFVDGSKGTLLAKLPLEWAFRRDPERVGVARKLPFRVLNLVYWNKRNKKLTVENRKNYPDEWEMIRTDLYPQAQGIRHPDRRSFTGDMWYRTSVKLSPDQTRGKVRLRFPGLFNECWLYVNDKQVAYRKQGKMWWLNDYRFEWDVDVAGKLNPGVNTITLRCNCEHHFGGLFRRPFLYRGK